MRLPCFIFVILFSAFSQSECILNGDLVPAEDLDNYKYLVAILARAKPRTPSEEPLTEACGGAILNERLILTAAHCFAKRSDGDIPEQALLKVIAHTRSNRDIMVTEGFMLREAARIYVYFGYFETRFDHDIAIVQLKKDLGLILNFHKVKTAKLPTADFSIEGKKAVLAGYGVYGFDGPKPLSNGLLRTMDVRASSDESLGEMLFRGWPIDISQPKGFCAGDSGGPLVIRSKANLGLTTDYTVIGLVKSNRAGCDDRQEGGVYTRVSYYLESFINKIMDDPENIVDDLIRVRVLSDVQACSNN